MSGFDRQIDADGRTVADAIREEVELVDYRLIRVVAYLDLIAECLSGLPDINDMGRRRRRLAEIRSGRTEPTP